MSVFKYVFDKAASDGENEDVVQESEFRQRK